MRRPNVLAVGMRPPPLGGQAVMFERAIDALRTDYDVSVIDTQLQSNIGEAGLFSVRKVFAVAKLLGLEIVPTYFRRKFRVLYYCVSGPSTFGLVKDLLFLALLRPRADKTVYHFHATGGVAFLSQKNALLRACARLVLYRPDLALRCADVTPNDAALCEAKRDIIVYNGIDDPGPPVDPISAARADIVITFIGALTEEKGIFDLVEIARLLRERGRAFTMYLVGDGTDDEVSKLDDQIRRHDLARHVHRAGVLEGEDKFALLRRSTIFVFPTFFRAETQPISAIEAISLGVPVVASDWRGLRTIVEDGVNGYLVPARAPIAFCDAIERILDAKDPAAMRAAARRIFLERFSGEKFAANLLQAFRSLVTE